MADEPLRPGNFDRAWNDPPQFSYAAAKKGSSGLKLNKRVAFPLSQGQDASVPLSATQTASRLSDAGSKGDWTSQIPPPPTPVLANVPPTSTLTPDARQQPLTPPGDEERQTVEESLQRLVHGLCMDVQKRDDALKRIESMKTKWESGDLPVQVQLGLVNLAAAIDQRDWDSALKIQTILVVDWPSECSPWMVAVKHLVTQSKMQQHPEQKNV